jgi:hypothetical protein
MVEPLPKGKGARLAVIAAPRQETPKRGKISMNTADTTIDTTAEVIAIVETATGRRLVHQAVDAIIDDLLDAVPAVDLDVDRVATHIIDLVNDASQEGAL